MTELLFRDDPYLIECDAVITRADAAEIELSHTVFYPAGGGQVGDSGRLLLADAREVRIVDTRKGQGIDDLLRSVPSDERCKEDSLGLRQWRLTGNTPASTP